MKANGESGPATDKTKFPWAGLVRLIAAVVSSLIAGVFLVFYTRDSYRRFQFEHPDATGLMNINEALLASGKWVFALPAVALLLGIVLLWARPVSIVVFEALVAAVWISSLLMFALPILSWQMQNTQTFSHMKWHF
jgi:hypothetical protein